MFWKVTCLDYLDTGISESSDHMLGKSFQVLSWGVPFSSGRTPLPKHAMDRKVGYSGSPSKFITYRVLALDKETVQKGTETGLFVVVFVCESLVIEKVYYGSTPFLPVPF